MSRRPPRATAATVAALLAAALPVALPPPADAAATTVTVVDHGTEFTAFFPDDICGDRAATTTFVRRVEQVHLTRLADGSFSYHDVGVYTYFSDYVDPDLPDLSGRGTEVNHVVLTPGDTFVVSQPFHDFFGMVRIRIKVHLTVLADGTPVVDRVVEGVTGCP